MVDRGSNFIVLAGLVSFSLIFILAGLMWRRRDRRMSLRRQLLFAVVGTAAISVFLIVAILVWRIRATLTDQIGQAFLVQATSNSQRLGVELAREIDLIRNLSEDEVFFNRITGASETELTGIPIAERAALLQAREQAWTIHSDEGLQATVLFNAASTKLADFRDNFPAHAQLLVTDRYGGLVAAAGLRPAHYYYGNQAWWLAAWQGRLFNTPYVGGSQVMSGLQGTTVDIAVAIHPPETPVSRGLLRSRFIIDALQVFADADPPGETGEFNLVDETGLVLYSSNSDRVGRRLPPAVQRLIVETPSGWREASDEADRAIILGHAALAAPPDRIYLDELGWTVVVQQAKAEALATVNRLSQIALFGGTAALALVAAVGSRMIYQLLRPIEELTAVASALAEDRLESRASVSGPEELRTLAQTFNQMAGRLQQTLEALEQRVFELQVENIERRRAEQALAESESRLRSILVSMDDMVFVFDNKGRFKHSYSPDEYLLLPAASFVGKKHADVMPPAVDRLFIQAFEQSRRGETAEYEYRLGMDSETTWYAAKLSPIFLDERVVGVVAVVRDITVRKRAEAEREALIVELEAKNAELERFAYTVSHDLKNPLITIRGFLGFVEQAAIAGEIERVQTDMTRIVKATEKMEQLLNEVLEISRIGRLVNPSEATPLTELAHEAVEMVRGRLEKRGVEVVIAPDLPTVYGDRPRLREVLENLVDNAVKYMGEQPVPRVEIGVKCDQNEPVIYVRDNGIGIEPRYHKKVFGLFDKLDQETEGNGVGLAIVQRIVEWHGGQIWIESDGTGQGSVFCFTLQTV